VSSPGPSAVPTESDLNRLPLHLACFAFVALFISILAFPRIPESDIWFHLRNAEEMLARGTFLNADLYTFTSAGDSLINHEWLSELPYYFAFKALGPQGLYLVYLSLLLLTFAGVYTLATRRGASPLNTALLCLFGASLGFYSFGPRMMHFGWVCLVILQLTLERFTRTSRSLWILPPLFAIWINLHGSWVFGFIIVGIQFASSLFNFQSTRVIPGPWNRTQLKKIATYSVVSFAALFANPYGYKLVWYPFDLLLRQQANMKNVIEWQSVDFQTGFGKLAMVMLFGIVAAFLFSKRPWELRDLLLIAFALWTSLTHVRFLIFAAILLVPIFAPRLHLFPSPRLDRPKAMLTLGFGCLVLIVLVAMLPSNSELQGIIDKNYPRDAVAFMRNQRIKGRLLHLYDWGGYLEWHDRDTKTFADGRTDIFVYNGVFEDYLQITSGRAPFETLDKYKIDTVLFPPNTPFTYLLDRSPAWKRIYTDPIASIYQRSAN
jgi:hypothetical protein